MEKDTLRKLGSIISVYRGKYGFSFTNKKEWWNTKVMAIARMDLQVRWARFGLTIVQQIQIQMCRLTKIYVTFLNVHIKY